MEINEVINKVIQLTGTMLTDDERYEPPTPAERREDTITEEKVGSRIDILV